ncbi:hypothetical protein OAS39_11050, partial [Pirellulales bacterium]|nr:hypothetical protein [Pirellulales bacterium]
LLSQTLIDAESGDPIRLAKPGHWTATLQQMQANYDDFDGRTVVAAVDPKSRKPIPLEHTAFAMVSRRAVVLAKNRPKWVHNELFVPEDAKPIHVATHVERAGSGQTIEKSSQSSRWTTMPPHQYFFLVLAATPTQYGFLETTDSVRGPWEDESENHAQYYRVVLAGDDERPPLPPNALTWTSVAFVLWDEVNIDRLESDQRQALTDWLHWGGRLIINGPDSLAALRGSFLDDFLPADPGPAVELTNASLAPLTEYWGRRDLGKPQTELKQARPWSGISLKLRDGARFVPHTANLLAERGVGLGSVVVSSMQLAERDLVNWPGYDGFLNGALLGRPGRRFAEGPFIAYSATWAESPDERLNGQFITPLRWFARDAIDVAPQWAKAALPAADGVDEAGYDLTLAGGESAKKAAPLPTEARGGVGAWREFSAASAAARRALRVAAGVRVPGAGFVVGCLACYLIVLAPLNWMVFHAIGRVEWAWIAAPIIAIIGTVVIVYQADLDIGFVRARTQIALLELQSDYPRGHLSRYDALYASLSTEYDLEFDNQTAVARPFPSDHEANAIESRLRLRPSIVEFQKYDKARLAGIAITSSATQYVHSEEMIDLEGGLRVTQSSSGGAQIQNLTGLDLQDAVVIRRRFVDGRDKPVLSGFWIGSLRNGEARALPLTPLPPTGNEIPFAKERAQAAKLAARARLDVDAILRLAFQFPATSDPRHGRRDETRLVARVDEIVAGADVDPNPSQAVGATVVVARLEYGATDVPAPDLNSAEDVKPKRASGAFEL